MKKSWKKALLAGLSIVVMGSFIAGCYALWCRRNIG